MRSLVSTLPVHDQCVCAELEEIGLAERIKDRIQVCLKQRQQRGVSDVASRDHQDCCHTSTTSTARSGAAGSARVTAYSPTPTTDPGARASSVTPSLGGRAAR